MLIAETEITKECRDRHGFKGAFEIAAKRVLKRYKIFNSKNEDRTFVLKLYVKTK